MLDDENELEIIYTIYCKPCGKYRRFRLLDNIDDVFNGGVLNLRCHNCQRYNIYIAGNKVYEHFTDPYERESNKEDPPVFKFDRELIELSVAEIDRRMDDLNHARRMLTDKQYARETKRKRKYG